MPRHASNDKGEAAAKLDALGIDVVLAGISDGKSLTEVAKANGVSFGALNVWLNRDDERSARAREARRLSARLWDEMAENRLDQASDPFELSRAKELAHHYRWRAAKIAPADYGEKVIQEHQGKVGFVVYGEPEKATAEEWTESFAK